MPKSKDPDMERFEKDLLQSIEEMKRGEHAVVHTPAQMEARKRGRPTGSVKDSPKVATTIRIDADVLAALKTSGPGWQTRANDALREFVTNVQYNVEVEDAVTRQEGLIIAAQIGLDISDLEQQTEALDTLRKQLTVTTELTKDMVKALERLTLKHRKSASTT